MQLNKCETLRILDKNSKISKEDMFILVYSADTKEDFLIQNYIKKQLLLTYGNSFIEKSQNKIETIVHLLSQKKEEELYDMYIKSFNCFMDSVNRDFNQITSFNIIFVFYINTARRVLMKQAGY